MERQASICYLCCRGNIPPEIEWCLPEIQSASVQDALTEHFVVWCVDELEEREKDTFFSEGFYVARWTKTGEFTERRAEKLVDPILVGVIPPGVICLSLEAFLEAYQPTQ